MILVFYHPKVTQRPLILFLSFILLQRTLQWVRSASPIIIHINLDKVLNFLVEDTHYRNRFETGTSGGSTDKVARKSWEVRIVKNVVTYCATNEVHDRKQAEQTTSSLFYLKLLAYKLVNTDLVQNVQAGQLLKILLFLTMYL